MDKWLFEKFHREDIISQSSFKNICQPFPKKSIPVSIALKMLLAAGGASGTY